MGTNSPGLRSWLYLTVLSLCAPVLIGGCCDDELKSSGGCRVDAQVRQRGPACSLWMGQGGCRTSQWLVSTEPCQKQNREAGQASHTLRSVTRGPDHLSLACFSESRKSLPSSACLLVTANQPVTASRPCDTGRVPLSLVQVVALSVQGCSLGTDVA